MLPRFHLWFLQFQAEGTGHLRKEEDVSVVPEMSLECFLPATVFCFSLFSNLYFFSSACLLPTARTEETTEYVAPPYLNCLQPSPQVHLFSLDGRLVDHQLQCWEDRQAGSEGCSSRPPLGGATPHEACWLWIWWVTLPQGWQVGLRTKYRILHCVTVLMKCHQSLTIEINKTSVQPL